MDGAILLTGATGLLGRYLLRDLTRAGHRVAVLVRPSPRHSAEDRVAGIIAAWEAQGEHGIEPPRVLTGDIGAPDLGLSAEDYRWASSEVDLVLHNAASLTFIASEGRGGEPWQSNLEGTRHVLDFCQAAEIVDFHHVSTAYVCGLRSGTVLESEGDVGQAFSNDYEESKLAAEQLVRDANFLAPPTFHRPSIIVGDSETGMTTTFHGYYALVRLASALVQMVEMYGIEEYELPLHGLEGHEVKNLIPVNWVSAAMTAIIGRRSAWGQTYHLTPAEPVRIDLITSAIKEAIGFRRDPAFVGGQAASEATSTSLNVEHDDIAATFYEQMKVYGSYFRDDPRFDRRNLLSAIPMAKLPDPQLDFERLVRLAKVAIDMNFRHRDPRPAKVPAIR